MDPSVIKVPSVITFGPQRNKSPIRNNILNPSVMKVLSVITFGPKCNKGVCRFQKLIPGADGAPRSDADETGPGLNWPLT